MLDPFKLPAFGFECAKEVCRDCFTDVLDSQLVIGKEFRCFGCDNVMHVVSMAEEKANLFDRFDRDNQFRDMVRKYEIRGLMFDRRYFTGKTASQWIKGRMIPDDRFNRAKVAGSYIKVDNENTKDCNTIFLIDRDGVFGIAEKTEAPVHANC